MVSCLANESGISFNVTRPFIREALAMLEALGIIEVRGREGIYVKEKTWNKIVLPLSFLI